jgi:kumamolisin
MEIRPASLIQVDPILNPSTGEPQTIGGYGTMTPPQIAKAYNIPASTGKGVKIGILSFGGGFYQSDLNSSFADLRTNGLIPSSTVTPTIKQVLLDGQSGSVSGDYNSSGENAVDIFCIATTVPEADITIYIGGSWATIFNRAIADGCHIISVSWATTEGFGDFLSTTLNNAETNKIAICVASGDWGSSFPGYGSLQVCYPSSSPKVISIGGTHLYLNANNTRLTETDDNRDPSFGSTWGGGGGISTIFSKPTWQNGLNYTPITNGTTGSPTALNARGIPDISGPMNVYSLYFNGSQAGFGGTSLSAPFIAGVLARYQQLTGIRRSSVEYNTLFYSNPNAFFDITVGTNNTQITSGYAGTTAWDPVTGLGPPIGTTLYSPVRPTSTFPKQNYGFRPASGNTYPRRTTGVR